MIKSVYRFRCKHTYYILNNFGEFEHLINYKGYDIIYAVNGEGFQISYTDSANLDFQRDNLKNKQCSSCA